MSDLTASDPPLPDLEITPWERHLSEPVAGRKVIVGFELLAGMTRTVANLRRWGAQRPLLLAEGLGKGPVPAAEDADVLMLDGPRYRSMTDQVRGRLRPAERLTDEARRVIDAYDPDHRAWWWFSPVAPNSELLGRPALGGRPPHQIALEDKAIVDDMLDRVGAPPSRAVLSRATYDDLMRATAEVLAGSDDGQVVWAGDASGGVNGGGDYVRWVRTTEQARDAAEFFASRCAQVRVSAFLEGVPCSIHGMVLPDGVAVLRPVELVTLRDPDRGRFVYAGMGTTWSPPPSYAQDMRDLARTIGRHLASEHRYVGAFGIDGVATAEGFRVTELNARLSGGLTRLDRSAPGTQLVLVQMNALLGRDIGISAGGWEELATMLVDETRFVDAMALSTAVHVEENVEVEVTAGPERLEIATGDDPVVGFASCGPSPLGALVRLTTVPDVMPIGSRAAPLSLLLLEFADRHWGTGFGTTLMAPDVLAGPR